MLENLKIKNLNFENATCMITIVSVHLQTLNVERVRFKNRSRLNHSFKIHAPKLSFFNWKGSAITNYAYSKSFSLLEQVVLEVRSDLEEGFDDFLKALLHSFQHAKRLEIRHHITRFRAEGFMVHLGRDSRIKMFENSVI